MDRRLLVLGILIWLAATALLRVAGQHIVPATPRATLITFAVSFPIMAWVARRACRRFQLPRAEWPVGAIALAAPTLVLDAFTSAFFPAVFPNIPPDSAGIFGGWMLWCTAGALFGATVGRTGCR